MGVELVIFQQDAELSFLTCFMAVNLGLPCTLLLLTCFSMSLEILSLLLTRLWEKLPNFSPTITSLPNSSPMFPNACWIFSPWKSQHHWRSKRKRWFPGCRVNCGCTRGERTSFCRGTKPLPIDPAGREPGGEVLQPLLNGNSPHSQNELLPLLALILFWELLSSHHSGSTLKLFVTLPSPVCTSSQLQYPIDASLVIFP